MHSKIIENLEHDMINVKQAMEQRGLNVDFPKLDKLIQKTLQEKNGIEQELKQILGIQGEVNFNSSRDVADILFKVLGVNPKRTRTGRYSTSRRVLKGVNNPLTDKIATYRNLEKLLSSLKAIHKATDKAKGKIFCRYIDTCMSGRLYTKSYSFQSIPEVARGIICADGGHSFIIADYNSFELRILSALSDDVYFKECWAKGLDLHRKVVADMKGVLYDSVTDKERKLGKTLNFGLAYGQEANGLARNLHISISEAQELMDVYKSKIPEIESFKSETIKKARSTGFTETYYGRKRFLLDINASNITDRKKAERRAVNHCIQGTAADILKFSLVKLHSEGFKISATVHDSALVIVPDLEIDKSLQRIKEIMEIEIKGMKFTVSCKIGKTWGECY
ncbi:MAG: hypothetical protein GY858_09545 [Candidatus Omnitrophica bacterium]|nr:hypothetical protein [Candidatus Omnitrophota bacterium]